MLKYTAHKLLIALLVAHGIAEDAPEQPDVVPQPCILLERQPFALRGFLSASGLQLGFGRHDLG